MEQLTIKLQNCYGIKKLVTTFDFSSECTYAIYAPNGTMKTSLAKTFSDLNQGQSSKDLIFPSREPVREIDKEDGSELLPEEVFAITIS